MRPARTTPACAGSTQVSSELANDNADHPRLRGEHEAMRKNALRAVGPPPPARGAHVGAIPGGGVGRTTPACAGSTR